MDLQRIQLLLGKNKRIVSQIIQRIHNMYLLTEWQGRTGNIWLKVMAYGPRGMRSVRHDREAKILPSFPI